MKVIFLNTWHGQLHDELRAYVQRHMQTTDVFCFQEAYPEDRAPYQDLLANEFIAYEVKRVDSADGLHYENITYVRKGIEVVETGRLFTDTDKDKNIGIAVYIVIKIDAENLTLCNVHGVPYPGHKLDSPERIRQSQTILDTFADRQNVIIGGDFNLLPATKSVQLFSEYGYQNLIADFDIASTRNVITYERHPENIQYHADFAFASSAIRVMDFVVPDEIVSDHQPLELTVAIASSRDIFGVPDVIETGVVA